MCLGRGYTVVVILTILVAVATALIAPSIAMPDTVLREHHVSLHAVGAHAANNLLNTGLVVPDEAVKIENASHTLEIAHLSNSDHAQSSIVLRC
jgi:hypothetical protein